MKNKHTCPIKNIYKTSKNRSHAFLSVNYMHGYYIYFQEIVGFQTDP